MRVYAEVAKRSFRRHSTYRAATAAGAFTNTVFGFIQAYVMLAVYDARNGSDVGGLDRTDALTYVFLTQSMIMVIGAFLGTGELGERVRTGEVVVDLYRPVDFQGYWLALDLGRSAFSLVARGAPPLLAGALVFDLDWPSPATWPVFFVSLTAGALASFGWRFIVSLSAFWLVDDKGAGQLSMVVLTFFSGFILPLNFFPDWLRVVCLALPFSTMVQLPVEVFLDKHHGAGLAMVLGYQALWAVVLMLIGRGLLASAYRRAEALGG